MAGAKATLPETSGLPSPAALLRASFEAAVKTVRRQVCRSRLQFQTVTIKMNISSGKVEMLAQAISAVTAKLSACRSLVPTGKAVEGHP
jgi:hypothetical protein